MRARRSAAPPILSYTTMCRGENQRRRDIMFEDMAFSTIGIALNIGIMMLASLVYYINRLSREGKD
jgi:hypothetical protein